MSEWKEVPETEPITHGGTDRGYKLCKCAKCGDVSVCTPFNDYYTARGSDNGPLFCGNCIFALAAMQEKK
jgi:hypothetical protein